MITYDEYSFLSRMIRSICFIQMTSNALIIVSFHLFSFMRNRNSVGGQRILPGNPILEDMLNLGEALIAQFREGMDRLNRERGLTFEEQNVVDNLSANSPLASEYTVLNRISQTLWQHALDKQQHHNAGNDNGFYSTEELGERLIATANRWQEFKRQLDDHA